MYISLNKILGPNLIRRMPIMTYLNPRTYLSSFYHEVYGNSLYFLFLTIFVLFKVYNVVLGKGLTWSWDNEAP